MHGIKTFLPIFLLFGGILACNLPDGVEPEPAGAPAPAEAEPPPGQQQPTETESEQPLEPEESEPASVSNPSGDVIQPDELIYLGAFRLPDASGGSSWEYSGHGLTYFPEGDPDGQDDGFPGSLFGVGHDHNLQVSEISIPVPVISKNLDDLNTVETLQPFADITGGAITEELALPRLGLEYLPMQGDQTTGKLHFTWGQHIQDFEPSHGWAELDLSNPQTAGTWVFDGHSNYTSNDYIFEIPRAWADMYTPGQYLATGRAREGPWSGNGPALFSYAPWQDGNPLEPGGTLSALTPLLLYGVQEPGNPEIISDESMAVNDRFDADHWWGGAWLTAGDKSAVIFVGTKAIGSAWYGYANGVVWEYGCDETNTCPEMPEWPYEDRGFWAEDYQAQIIFYDPVDLAAVARGDMESWQPQPYATLVLDEFMLTPELDFANYKRDIIAAAAFDRANGLLYVIERLADEYKSVVHVWRVEAGETASASTQHTSEMASSDGEPLDKWSLWIAERGTQLRGANVHQWRVYPELVGTEVIGPGSVGPPFTQDDFDHMSAMGANYVNLSVPGIYTINPPYELDQGVLDNLDNVLDMIANAHMYAVISYRTGPGRTEFTFFWDEVGDWFDESYLNDSMWGDQDAQDAWVEMWRVTAEHYRDIPIVVGYDLMVEPNANEVGDNALVPLDIWDAEEFYAEYGGTLYDWGQLYPRITDAIREVDSETPIIIGGMGYSAVDWLPYLEPTGDPRTVYAAHQYMPYVYTHQSPDDPSAYPGTYDLDWDGVDDDFARAWLDNWLSTVDEFSTTHGVPVVVNEFGGTRWNPGLAQFMDDQMSLFEERGLNYAFWEWPSSWEPFVSGNNAFNFLFGPDPEDNQQVETSDFIEVVRKYWGRNTVRP
ncbi:MAG: cellulase family glycosylhydrolase [Anaerolineales bacterium]|nr:cellulase family glycosylhydrolase [Anaerolineales bacterium]